jgi:MFS family permease
VDTGTIAAMMTVLLLGSVPGPIIAGWLSDRIGRKPMIVAIYVCGAISILLFISAGSNLAWIWATVILLAIFSFVESPQLQALLADMVRPGLRDASFSLYFTLAFGVGAMWTAIYGAITGALGNDQGLPVVFVLMALAYLAAAVVVLPIRAEQRAAAARAEELALIAAREERPPR